MGRKKIKEEEPHAQIVESISGKDLSMYYLGSFEEINSMIEKLDLVQQLIEKLGPLEALFKLLDKVDQQCWFLKDFLTAEEAAVYLNVSKGTLYKMKDENDVPYYLSNDMLFFKRQELDHYLAKYRFLSYDELVENAKRTVEELKAMKKKGYKPKSRSKKNRNLE